MIQVLGWLLEQVHLNASMLCIVFKRGQGMLGMVQHAVWYTCQAGHLNAVAAISGSRDDLMQKHHLAFVVGDAQGQQTQASEFLRQSGQFMKMRGE